MPLFISLVLATSDTSHKYNEPLTKNEIDYTFFSLPDGESMLIQTGRDKEILINTGSKKSEDILLEQLNALNIEHLDTLILTNQEEGTCGNTKRLVSRYNIKRIVYADEWTEVCSEKNNNDVSLVKWKQDQLHELSPGLFSRVLPTNQPTQMSLFIYYGKTSMLFLANGDLENEKNLMEIYPMDAEILKVGEYAQTTSPSMTFLDKVDPHLAIIYNQEGVKVNEGLIERLNESWIDVFFLKNVGTLEIRCSLEDYEILNQR